MQIKFISVIHLLHSCASGVFATHSQQLEGYPYATILPLALDEQHRPIFLVSNLAEHSKNLMADQRVSLLLSDSAGPQVLKGARVTVVGDAEQFSPAEELVNRYLCYQPDAKQYLELGDFLFFRLLPKRARYIAGFGEMGWVSEEDLRQAAILPLSDEEAVYRTVSPELPRGVRILGIDAYGFDVEHDGKRDRHQFADGPIQTQNIAGVISRFLHSL